MSNSPLEMLTQMLGDQGTAALGQRLGVDSKTAGSAASAAIPMILGALQRNASNSGGAESLLGALSRDHDGSILDNLGGFLQGGKRDDGEAILGHVFGKERANVEAGIGKASGLDTSSVGPLLQMLAPVVMGALGKSARSGQLDANGLQSLLTGERRKIEKTSPQAGGLLGSLLDRDGDGSIADDVAGFGMSFLGKALRRK